jgi:DNA-binding transcriptional MerR regulator
MGLKMLFDLNELCEEGEVTARTVRYYIQQGLLPSPGLGSGVRYTDGHLARLRLIRRLQREHLPLAEIRRRLMELDDAAVQRLLATSAPAGGTPTTAAVDYVRAVLGGTVTPEPQAPMGGPPPPRPTTPPGAGGAARPQSPAQPPRPTGVERAQWDRIALSPDIELHVRRPLSRQDNQRVDRLLELARALLAGEEV